MEKALFYLVVPLERNDEDIKLTEEEFYSKQVKLQGAEQIVPLDFDSCKIWSGLTVWSARGLATQILIWSQAMTRSLSRDLVVAVHAFSQVLHRTYDMDEESELLYMWYTPDVEVKRTTLSADLPVDLPVDMGTGLSSELEADFSSHFENLKT